MRLALALLLPTVLLASPAAADEFEPLFNGSDLTGWEGDGRFWQVEDGAIVGRTTEDNKTESNTFLIYRGDDGGAKFGDFELTFEYQVEGFNSGIQYRSEQTGDGFTIKGYQADFEARWHDDGTADKFSGMFFEELGRMFLAQRGQAVVVRNNPDDAKKPRIEVVGSVGDAAELEQAIDRDGWNRYRILADGHSFTHIINDRVMSVAFDEDVPNRRDSGLIALQLHGGPPMEIRVRDLKIRRLHTDGGDVDAGDGYAGERPEPAGRRESE